MGRAAGLLRLLYIGAAALVLWPVSLPPANSQNLTVQGGSTLNLGNGTLDLGCGDLTIAGSLSIGSGVGKAVRDVTIDGGSLTLGSGLISLSGDWTNLGSFSAGTGTVTIVDDCGTSESRLVGNSDFYGFAVTSGSGRLLEAAAGATQTFANRLTLRGTTSDRLFIRSSLAGVDSYFQLAPGGTQDIFAVDVADNDASGGQVLVPQLPASAGSVDSGNTTNWFIPLVQQAVSIITLPTPALVLLALLLILAAIRFRQVPATGKPRP